MDPTLKAIVFAIAIAVWVLGVILKPPPDDRTRLVSLGLAIFAVPFLVDAIDAS